MSEFTGNTQKYEGADANIFKTKDQLYGLDFVKANIHFDPDNLPVMNICVSPGRNGSTALLGLFASHPWVLAGYYQPWKTMVRHGLQYGPMDIPGVENGYHVFAKETWGPFHEEEQFDPVALMLDLGYPAHMINLITLARDPLATVYSNFKFDGGITPEILVANYQHTFDMFNYYQGKIGAVVPLAYDLMQNGTTDHVLANTLGMLGLPFMGRQFDSQSLMFVEQGGQFHPGEAKDEDEAEAILLPTFARGGFNPKIEIYTLDSLAQTKRAHEKPEMLEVAAAVHAGVDYEFQQFVQISADALSVTLH